MAGYKAMDDMTYFEECFAKGQAYQVGEVAGIWTTPVTFHVAFRAIPDLITKEAVLAKIRSLDKVSESGKGESGARSAWWRSTSTAARAGCSAGRRSTSSGLPSSRPRPRASTWRAPCP